MRERIEDTPFPLPPLEGAMTQWPDKVPWNTPIFQMSDWWLEITCPCSGDTGLLPLRLLPLRLLPLRLLAARIGWRRTLRDIVPFLRCRRCQRRGSANVELVDGPAGDQGRYGSRAKRMHLHP